VVCHRLCALGRLRSNRLWVRTESCPRETGLRSEFSLRGQDLADEIRHFWLVRGISLPAVYEANAAGRLQQLLDRQVIVNRERADVETAWFEAMAELDKAEATG